NIIVNHDRLVYAYDDSGRVAMVRYVDPQGNTFTNVRLSYTGRRLTGLQRDRRVEGGFIVDKTISLSYHADGNLEAITEHLPPIDGIQNDATFVTRFEEYDTGMNVDGFSLLHDEFFDHLVWLPGVRLQKSNPRKETRTGDGLNYAVEYTYSYDDRNRPRSKD